MDKLDFLLALDKRLDVLSETDRRASLDYYSEILDDLVEGGMTETDAVASLGSVDAIAEEILMDIPLPKLVKAKMKGKKPLSGLEITLLIVGFPIWLPILISVFAVIFAVYISLWAVVISLYAANVAMAACAPTGILAAVVLFASGKPTAALLFLGAGLALAGLSILWFLLCNLTAKGMWKLCRLTLRGTKACFIRKKGE